MGSRWIPRIPAQGSGGGGPPPQIQDHFCPKIIVGNVPAGDPAVAQAAPFQYVPDPGDGTGIALALGSLPAGGGDVCVRPGTYDLAGPPLVVPSNSTLFGAGPSTLIRNLTGSRRIVTVGVGGEVRGVALVLGAAPQGSAGVEAVFLSAGASGARFRESSINVLAASPDESLTALVRTGAGAVRCRVELVTLTGPASAIPSGVVLDGSDHAIEDLVLDGVAATAVVFVQGSLRCTAQAVRGNAEVGFSVEGDRHAMDGVIDVTDAGIGADLVDCSRCRVELVSQGASPAAGSFGVRVQAGVRNTVSGSILQDHDTGISVLAGATRTIVLGNQLEAATAPLLDAGSLTEAAHNGLTTP
jgi:hypothetical protein